MNDAAHPSDIEFGGETVEVLQSLWDAGERERAVAWARNVLSNERASLPFKVRTAGLLQSWGELKNEITILDALRDRPEQLLVAGRFGDVGAYLSLLGARDGEEAA